MMTEFGTSHLPVQGTRVQSPGRGTEILLACEGQLERPCAAAREKPVQCSEKPVRLKFKDRKVV